MRLSALISISLSIMFSLAPVAWAEVDCNSECPDGKVKVSFADGNHTSCMCVDASEGMEPTNEVGGPTCADADDDGECD